MEDAYLDQMYHEAYLTVDHKMRIGRRGSVDQKVMLSQIESDVAGIPYSIFSGRQPGKNWKYTVNARYTFSNRFQLSMNYSIQERGATEIEQFMRLEGRTHF